MVTNPYHTTNENSVDRCWDRQKWNRTSRKNPSVKTRMFYMIKAALGSVKKMMDSTNNGKADYKKKMLHLNLKTSKATNFRQIS